mmetsp:Transcript_1545/g.3111  ORF Transcript_1545/g.3111 Transcript_1545/m.3111 type:complete len:651 (+) Transcript_1545:49-2001(+)
MDRKDIGIIVNVAGSILINLGNNLQSSGHRGNRKRSWTDEGLGLADRSDNEEDSGEDVELARPRTPGRRQEEIFLPAEVNATQAGSWKATTPRGSKTPDTWVPDTSSEIESSRQLIASLLDCSGGSDDDDEHDADSDDKSRALRRRRLLRKAAPVSMNGDASPGGKPPPCTEFVQWALKKLRRVCDVWLIGTCLFVCGTAAVFVSYSFAPQSLLAPLGSTQFVSNVVFARFIHNAPVTKRMLISTSIIMCGIALVVKFSPSPNPDVAELGVATLQELYTYGAYQVYVTVLASLAGCFHLSYRTYRQAYRLQRPLYGDAVVRPVAYAVLSAIIGTQSTLQAKCLSGLLVSPDAGQALGEGFTYLALAGFLLGTAFWLYRMNRALALFEPLFIIPVLQVFWTFFATLNGGIYFREFMGAEFLAHSIGGFVSGVFVIFFGVYLLAPKSSGRASSLLGSSNGQNDSGHLGSIGEGGGLGPNGRPLSPQLRPVRTLIHKIDQDLPALDSRLIRHEAALARTSSLGHEEEGGNGFTPALAATTGTGTTAFPATRRGARAVAALLEEAQVLLFGDETQASAGSLQAGLVHSIPGAVGSAPMYNPVNGGCSGGAPSYKPRLVSFVGELPVLIAHEQTARAFDHIIPTLDGMHDSDEEN